MRAQVVTFKLDKTKYRCNTMVLNFFAALSAALYAISALGIHLSRTPINSPSALPVRSYCEMPET